MKAIQSVTGGFMILLTMGCSMVSGAQPSARDCTIGVSEEVPLIARPCTRVEDGTVVDFGALLHLTNKSVVTVAGKRSWQLTLSGLSVLIKESGSKSAGGLIDVFEIRRMINRDAPPDIDLSFALLDGSLYVYWRETYKHRSFDQGLYKFEAGKLSYFCMGSGGVDSSH
jgi:hypothetical protein